MGQIRSSSESKGRAKKTEKREKSNSLSWVDKEVEALIFHLGVPSDLESSWLGEVGPPFPSNITLKSPRDEAVERRGKEGRSASR